MPSNSLKDYRKQRGWSQRECGAALHVTANTVARWERGEIRVPAWVDVVINVWTHSAEHLQAVVERAQKLEERVTVLKATITTLELRNLALEHRLRQKRARAPRPPRTPAIAPRRKAEQNLQRPGASLSSRSQSRVGRRHARYQRAVASRAPVVHCTRSRRRSSVTYAR